MAILLSQRVAVTLTHGDVCSVRTPAASALDGAGRETGDVVLHEERIDEGHGNGAQQRPGHQLAPVEGVPADQLAYDSDRHGSHARAAEKEQRVEELVLRQREGKDARGNEAG